MGKCAVCPQAHVRANPANRGYAYAAGGDVPSTDRYLNNLLSGRFAGPVLATTNAAHYTAGTTAFGAFGAIRKLATAAALIANIFRCAWCAGRGFVARIENWFRCVSHVALAMNR